MDELERGGERQHVASGRMPDRARGGEREHRPDALAAGQQRVAHRLLEAGGVVGGGEAQVGEVALDLVAQVVGVGGARAGLVE